MAGASFTERKLGRYTENMQARKPIELPQPVIWLILFAALVANRLLIGGIGALASGNWERDSITAGLPLFLYFSFVLGLRPSRPGEKPMEDPPESCLQLALSREGLPPMELRTTEDRGRSLNVRGATILIPSAMLQDLTPEALIWSVRRAVALDQWWRSKLLGYCVAMVCVDILCAVARHWQPVGAGLINGILYAGIFLVMIVSSARASRTIEHQLTQSASDREAATEALSDAYFRTLDSKFWNALGFAARQRKRADRLRLELERGYRAPRHDTAFQVS